MASKYQEEQRLKVVSLMRENDPIFEGDSGGEMYRKKYREFILMDSQKNLFPKIRSEVQEYFKENNISWWGGGGPSGHVLSSQIACLNHLFYLKNDFDGVTSLLKSINKDLLEPLLIRTDQEDQGYIQFEAVSDKDHLNEKNSTRGSNCTSIDALIYAKHEDDSKWLILIEWKYTEFYGDQNKAEEVIKFGSHINDRGKERQKRYNNLIHESDQLKIKELGCYYFEPFYQLMRQTLWAEQMIKFKDIERLSADDFLHVHVIPSGNRDLLNKPYKCSGMGMEETWRKHLNDQSKYKIISPQELIRSLFPTHKYQPLINYLETRYWA
jgi:restriction endonuclease-like protein